MSDRRYYPKNINSESRQEGAKETQVEFLKLKAELEYYKELSNKNKELYYDIVEDCVRGRSFGVICNDCTVIIYPDAVFPPKGV